MFLSMGMCVYTYGLHVSACIHLHGYVYRYDLGYVDLGGYMFTCACSHMDMCRCIRSLVGAYVTMYLCMCKCITINVSMWATMYVFEHSIYEFQSE